MQPSGAFINCVETPHGNVGRLVGHAVLNGMLRYAPVPADTLDPDQARLDWLIKVISLPDRVLLSLPGVGQAKLGRLRKLSEAIAREQVWTTIPRGRKASRTAVGS